VEKTLARIAEQRYLERRFLDQADWIGGQHWRPSAWPSREDEAHRVCHTFGIAAIWRSHYR